MTGVLVVPRKIIGWRKGSVPQLFATSTSNVRRPLSKPYGVVNTHLCAYQLHWGRWPFTKYVGCKKTKQKGVRRVYSNPTSFSATYIGQIEPNAMRWREITQRKWRVCRMLSVLLCRPLTISGYTRCTPSPAVTRMPSQAHFQRQ